MITICLGVSMPAEASVIEPESSDIVSFIDLESIDLGAVNTLVEETMNKSKVPGMSIVLVSGNQSRYLNYGYANVEEQIVATANTYYELGSMSKAFTALGILLLEDEGKLSLEDPITKYLPWFQVYYKGIYEGRSINKTVELTIGNLLYHTSGIPFQTIGDIPEGVSDDMLEKTVRNLTGAYLDYYPGEKYQYTTINYDILGLIIQSITGKSYEQFIQECILSPLELNHTYLFHYEAQKNGVMATGYKMTFFDAKAYDAPHYRGNTPAGYIISNTMDMERWMKIQMGIIEVPEQLRKVINKSHEGDISVPTQGNYYYASGWNVHIKGNDIQHGGSNPNFSTVLLMKPELRFGICILTNLNSNAADYLAKNICNLIEGKEHTKYFSDNYKNLDIIFSIVIICSILLSGFFLVLLIHTVVKLIEKKRVRTKLKGGKIAEIILALPLMVFLGFCIYYLPNILFQRLSWHAVNVWCSSMIIPGCILCFIMCIIFMAYVLLSFSFPQKKERNYFAMIPLSLINGIASAMIILTINESFNRNLEYSKELSVYFIFFLLFFVYTIKLLRGHLIVITNEIAYEKRMNIIDKIMCSSYQAIENIGRERVFSGLNNDCAEIVQMPGIIVNFVSNMLTLIFCLAYLLARNIWVFIASIVIIFLNGFINIYTSKSASKYWEKNRDVQDTYYSLMQNLVNGFKELVLNKTRRVEFSLDMKKFTRLSTELNKVAAIKFLNFDMYNVLMYNLVFGVVVFLFPLLIFDIDTNQLRENLFIVFYMIGPFGAVTDAVPRLTQLNVNMRRINKLIEDLEKESTSYLSSPLQSSINITSPMTIQLQDILFRYKPKENNEEVEVNEFLLGPLSCSFHSGESTYITGGNGSGKSTMGKLIAGLYAPIEGKILVNGHSIALQELNELFASVYSDFNLFKKLYGINYKQDHKRIMEYLEMMQIGNKVELTDKGEFSNINLSAGQRKRLAFVISCLEDKPFLILDEWAAEQDPQFRRYFYEELLPMLKRQGKGVIVITHDDRYFDRADQLIKLERGKMIESYNRIL